MIKGVYDFSSLGVRIPLGDWFAYVRDLRREGDLDIQDATTIEALPGWHW